MRTQLSSAITLLLVEDNPTKLASLQFLLNCAGYTVLVATSEESAVACASRERVQLVLIGEDFLANHGFTLCTWLRRIFSFPIVIFAPLQHPDDLAMALRLGVDEYISKPIPHTLLLARLAAVLQNGRRSRPQYSAGRSLRLSSSSPV